MSLFSNTKIFYHNCSYLPFNNQKNVLYITDSNTTSILKKSNGYSKNIAYIEIPSGEASKNLTNIEKILAFALDVNIGRDGIFVGFGGGLVLDMTGFASSIYMRGIDSVYVPTTLLAMVDASIGGKTGVDFSSFKNIIGTFHSPKEVHISNVYLESLSTAQYFSGFAELIKIALINRPCLYSQIKKNILQIKNRSFPNIINMIQDAIEAKIEITSQDFYEENIRSYLNLGHTFAHALESTLDFQNISHGEAVAWGIGRALSLGLALKKTKKDYVDDVLKLLSNLNYSIDPIPSNFYERLEKKAKNIFGDECDTKEKIAFLLIEKMKKDKKNRNGSIRLVLQRDLGETFVEEVDKEKIKKVLI